MAEEVQISPCGMYILVRSSGHPSLDELKQTLSGIVKLNRDHKLNKVLVDSRSRSGQPSVFDIFKGAEFLAETLGSEVRVAVLVDKIEYDHKFFENVAVNRFASVAFFQNEDLALQWLS